MVSFYSKKLSIVSILVVLQKFCGFVMWTCSYNCCSDSLLYNKVSQILFNLLTLAQKRILNTRESKCQFLMCILLSYFVFLCVPLLWVWVLFLLQPKYSSKIIIRTYVMQQCQKPIKTMWSKNTVRPIFRASSFLLWWTE